VTFRCPNCRGVVWLPDSKLKAADERDSHIRCRTCHQRYYSNSWRRACTEMAAIASEARRLVLADGLDLPAAYSVTLGLMTLDDARLARAERPARKVQDTPAPPPSPETTTRPVHALRWAGGVAILAAGLIYLGSAGREPLPAAGSSSTIAHTFESGAAEVATDDGGRILLVSAPDPASVLEAYCRSWKETGRLQAIDVVPPAVDPVHTRLGLLRSPAEPGSVRAITIRLDRKDGRWVAGDGRTPLEAEVAPNWTQDRTVAPRGSES
jgi:hypothetical protein